MSFSAIAESSSKNFSGDIEHNEGLMPPWYWRVMSRGKAPWSSGVVKGSAVLTSII